MNRSLQQSHFRGRKHIGFKKWSSPVIDGVARISDGLVNVAWVVLHCIRRIGARKRRQLIPHVRFYVPLAGKSIEIRLRMCGPSLLFLQAFATLRIVLSRLGVALPPYAGRVVHVARSSVSSGQRIIVHIYNQMNPLFARKLELRHF